MATRADTHPSVAKSDLEWRQILTPEQYYVTCQHGTERAFTGPYWFEKRAGSYACTCCNAPLFSSEAKFAGWPSFCAPVANERRKHARGPVIVRPPH